MEFHGKTLKKISVGKMKNLSRCDICLLRYIRASFCDLKQDSQGSSGTVPMKSCLAASFKSSKLKPIHSPFFSVVSF